MVQALHRRIIDQYPQDLKAQIDQVRKSIDKDTHAYMIRSFFAENAKPASPSHVESKGFIPFFLKSTKVFSTPFPLWVVKTQSSGSLKSIQGIVNSQGSARFINPFMKRPILACKMRKVVEDNKLDRILIPEKYSCSYSKASLSKVTEENQLVFLFVKRVNVLDKESTIKAINNQPEEEVKILSKQICTLEKKSGHVDLNLENFGVDAEDNKKIVMFDTEPMSLFGSSKICISTRLKCARIGLQRFSNCLTEYEKKQKTTCPAFKIFREDCAKTIKEIKKEELKLTGIFILKIATCLAIVPIPIYIYQSLSRRREKEKALIQSLKCPKKEINGE